MRIAASFLLLILLTLGSANAQLTQSSDVLKLGEDMPEFTILSLEGKELSSEELYGKVVLINFFATWCPPCKRELPELEKEVWTKYKDREDFVLMIISREEVSGKVLEFVKENKYAMPFYLDPKREVYNLFATKNIPRNYLFDKQGRLMLHSMGFKQSEFDTMVSEIEELLK
ncbi:MAG: TlpA disulfide reductase family protein [Bacteroidales bacterium]|nr:TlpA disulfide reductase family protein [Bacteroidales bacterium]NLO68163.1 TlpA family protein disulfide reductase [Bacteroidales bacterium]